MKEHFTFLFPENGLSGRDLTADGHIKEAGDMHMILL